MEEIKCVNCWEKFIPPEEDQDTCPNCQEMIRLADLYEDQQLDEIEQAKLEHWYGGMVAINKVDHSTCGNCGATRTIENGFVLECENCGDDEYEIALVESKQVP